jgi:hypothetical protein
MTDPWNILRHTSVWAAAARKDGDGGGGGGGDKSGSGTSGKGTSGSAAEKGAGGTQGTKSSSGKAAGGGGGSDRDDSAQQAQAQADRAAKEAAQAEANRQAALASQMEQERRNRAAQEAKAAEAERQRQAAAQAEANRQAQAAREAAERQRQAAAQAEANRQAQAAREAADRQQRQQDLARQMEEQQRQEDAARQRAADEARLAEQRNQEAAVRRAQEAAAIRAEQARAGIETLAPAPSTPAPYTPRTDTFVESFTDIADVMPPPTTSATVIGPPTGALTPAQQAAQQSGIAAQQQAYQDMLARAQAAQAARQEPAPFTPVPTDFVPSIDLLDSSGSLLPPERDRAGTVSIGYGPGQVDPALARAAGVQEGQPAFGQTTGPSTIEALYGVENVLDLAPTPENLADLTLGTGRFADTQQLLQGRPDLVLAPSTGSVVMGTGQVPAGTPGVVDPSQTFEMDKLQVLPVDMSYQAQTVYQNLGLTPFQVGTVSQNGQTTPVFNYRDPQGRVYSAAEARDFLQSRGAQTTTLPGGYFSVAPAVAPIAPVIDLGISPVSVALPVTTVPGGGAPAQTTVSQPAGIETIMDRSPTLGQPASTTVPQAADIVMPQIDRGVSTEQPVQISTPTEDLPPTVEVAAPELEDTGEEVAVDVEAPAPTEQELVEQGWGWDKNGDGKISLGERLGDMLDGGGKNQSGEEFEGGGVLSDIGNFLGGPGTGEGAGPGAGGGEGPDADQEMTEVVVDETPDEEQPPVTEEEPSFECPTGFRRVQMPNGGFTCVPEMVRPRVAPYTQPVSVAPLAGRTPFRPGARRA